MTFILIIFAFSLANINEHHESVVIPQDSLVTFYWIGDKNEGAEISNSQIGDIESFKIEVPSGFTVDHNFYGEGLLTSLFYSDGTWLSLHHGGNMEFSVVEGEAIEERSSPTGYGTVRFGIENGKRWGAYLNVYGPMINVLYTDAPEDRNSEFAKALSSVKLSGASTR